MKFQYYLIVIFSVIIFNVDAMNARQQRQENQRALLRNNRAGKVPDISATGGDLNGDKITIRIVRLSGF